LNQIIREMPSHRLTGYENSIMNRCNQGVDGTFNIHIATQLSALDPANQQRTVTDSLLAQLLLAQRVGENGVMLRFPN